MSGMTEEETLGMPEENMSGMTEWNMSGMTGFLRVARSVIPLNVPKYGNGGGTEYDER